MARTAALPLRPASLPGIIPRPRRSQDSQYLFHRFVDLIAASKAKRRGALGRRPRASLGGS
jgi:hypothetical protein